ncbi:hypothetical protein IB276_26010 [Ensifer sp. ENS04]|uniref:hypothetical protein n=1 Tax=Ensifer sp. ENS04 TaxID=2769281 RepID=UPI0017817874|nr:hypothetical protein [Ensifer sp. ENS04]MBD9542905.1 hypothetical protein [Ensifer sp. ENS04]
MYRPSADELDDNYAPTACTASSAEPMQRADHRAKKHGKPYHSKKWPGFPGERPREAIGGGHFVFKRGKRTGRIENRGIPFEHSSLDAALSEAARLTIEHGGQFDVFSRIGVSREAAE